MQTQTEQVLTEQVNLVLGLRSFDPVHLVLSSQFSGLDFVRRKHIVRFHSTLKGSSISNVMHCEKRVHEGLLERKKGIMSHEEVKKISKYMPQSLLMEDP